MALELFGILKESCEMSHLKTNLLDSINKSWNEKKYLEWSWYVWGPLLYYHSAIISRELNLPCFFPEKSLLVTQILPSQILQSYSMPTSYSMVPAAWESHRKYGNHWAPKGNSPRGKKVPTIIEIMFCKSLYVVCKHWTCNY